MQRTSSKALSATAAEPRKRPLYAHISTGDYQYHRDWHALDSAATIEALFEMMAEPNHITRVDWRGKQDALWQSHHMLRRENPRYIDIHEWIRHLVRDVGTNEIARAAARRLGIEMHVFDGIFEYAAQGDAGGCGPMPYVSEDSLRLEHPEWIPCDRWGECVAPGPIEFCYPEARKALVERYIGNVAEYDGISFYTYVENTGAHYLDEFGFNEPIVAEFKRRHGVDIRTEDFDREAWARLRGEYFTQFLRELHTALAAEGKRLSIVLSPDDPHLPQNWGGMPFPGTGHIYLDWENWAKESIVDELICWFRGANKEGLLRSMLDVCKGTATEVVLADKDPFADKWKPYLDAGAIPMCAPDPFCKGADRFAPGSVGIDALQSGAWGERVQALLDIGSGSLKADASAVSGLVSDPHPVARRAAVQALVALGASEHGSAVEAALGDRESSVRIAAADALVKLGGPDTPRRLLAALEQHGTVQMKEACILALKAARARGRAEDTLIAGTRSRFEPVREVCVRALEGADSPESLAALLKTLRDDEDYRVRYWSAEALAGRGGSEAVAALAAALEDSDVCPQIAAARALGISVPEMAEADRDKALAALEESFRLYGDGCGRADAAWGWRVVGNAISGFGPAGRELLESMRTQAEDRWLAWAAYLVLYLPQSEGKAILSTEEKDIATHSRYAPPFPGHRS
jgi:HEAT repeat protein